MLIKALPISYREKISDAMAAMPVPTFSLIKEKLLSIHTRDVAWNLLPTQTSQPQDTQAFYAHGDGRGRGRGDRGDRGGGRGRGRGTPQGGGRGREKGKGADNKPRTSNCFNCNSPDHLTLKCPSPVTLEAREKLQRYLDNKRKQNNKEQEKGKQERRQKPERDVVILASDMPTSTFAGLYTPNKDVSPTPSLSPSAPLSCLSIFDSCDDIDPDSSVILCASERPAFPTSATRGRRGVRSPSREFQGGHNLTFRSEIGPTRAEIIDVYCAPSTCQIVPDPFPTALDQGEAIWAPDEDTREISQGTVSMLGDEDEKSIPPKGNISSLLLPISAPCVSSHSQIFLHDGDPVFSAICTLGSEDLGIPPSCEQTDVGQGNFQHLGGSVASSPPRVCGQSSSSLTLSFSHDNFLLFSHPCDSQFSFEEPRAAGNLLGHKDLQVTGFGQGYLQFMGGSVTSSPPPVCAQTFHVPPPSLSLLYSVDSHKMSCFSQFSCEGHFFLPDWEHTTLGHGDKHEQLREASYSHIFGGSVTSTPAPVCASLCKISFDFIRSSVISPEHFIFSCVVPQALSETLHCSSLVGFGNDYQAQVTWVRKQ